MAATAAQVAQLRRMIAEPDDTTYSDADLTVYIESWPLADADGNAPSDTGWAARYDMAAAASELWAEKAAVAAQNYDFSADGGNYTRSQAYEQAMKQSRFYASRKAMGAVKVFVEPKPTALSLQLWVGNLPELDI